MKTALTVLFFLLIGITASAWAAGDAANGKALVKSKKCDLCHKAGSDTGKPMEALAKGKDDAFLKGAITNPKGTLGPDVKMPATKLSDAEVNDIVAYLRSIAK